MIEQTVEEVEEAMRNDPYKWAKLYLDLKDTCDKFEILVTKHQEEIDKLIQNAKI